VLTTAESRRAVKRPTSALPGTSTAGWDVLDTWDFLHASYLRRDQFQPRDVPSSPQVSTPETEAGVQTNRSTRFDNSSDVAAHWSTGQNFKCWLTSPTWSTNMVRLSNHHAPSSR
jgi:hypothetical protein